MAKKKHKRVVQQHKANFDTLCDAITSGKAYLLECKNKLTGEMVATVCAVNYNYPEPGTMDLVPLCVFLNGNPYDILEPPIPVDPA